MQKIVYCVPSSTKKDGESAIYRHPAVVNKALRGELIHTDGVRVSTLHENFLHGASFNGGKNPCFGERIINADGSAGAFKWITYREALTRITNVAAGLDHLGLSPYNEEDKMRKLGFFAKNRLDWVVSQQACHLAGIVVVPMYDTLGPDAAQYIVVQCDITTIVCGVKELDVVFNFKHNAPALKYAIVLDPVTSEHNAKAEKLGLKLLSLSQIESVGSKNIPKSGFAKIDPNSVAMFCYTSGTTGDPKGAMETHYNILADLAGVQDNGLSMVSSDIHLSYLPLAHMFEVVTQTGIIGAGGAVGFYQGDTLKLVDDLVTLRPTIFPSVPRLYNRIYDKIIGGVEAKGGVAKWLFMRAYAAKKYYLTEGFQHHTLWDTLVFNKVKTTVGLDRCRIMVTGSAPIANHVMEFLRIVFGCVVMEGYGQTECGAGATITLPADLTVGHVGGPITANEIKLVDVPDMNYLSTDKPFPRGEICYRGPNIFAGYYKMPEKTAEAIDSDGWLHSGDIAQIIANGAVKIIDRKKNIFKLAQGEYVAAEKIENIYIKSPVIAQAFVYGDSLQSFLVGVIVVDPETFPAWAKAKNIPTEKDKVNSPTTHKAILNELERIGKENGLAGFEMVKAVHIELTPWTPDETVPVLTPTFKLIRKKAQDRYQNNINAMYAAVGNGITQSKL